MYSFFFWRQFDHFLDWTAHSWNNEGSQSKCDERSNRSNQESGIPSEVGCNCSTQTTTEDRGSCFCSPEETIVSGRVCRTENIAVGRWEQSVATTPCEECDCQHGDKGYIAQGSNRREKCENNSIDTENDGHGFVTGRFYRKRNPRKDGNHH